VWGEDKDKTETTTSLANARLIAAAPELLEALDRMVVSHYPDANGQIGTQGECLDAILNAKAAIAKAKGEGE